jgi:hypothetical protein
MGSGHPLQRNRKQDPLHLGRAWQGCIQKFYRKLNEVWLDLEAQKDFIAVTSLLFESSIESCYKKSL